jgi:host factor-I protein
MVYKHAISTVVPARNPRGGGNPAMTSTGAGAPGAPVADEGFGNQ